MTRYGDDAIKSQIQQYIALNRTDATSGDLSRLYAVSQTLGACADLRAENIASVPLRAVLRGTDTPVDSKHPLARLISSAGMYDLMLRTELSMFFWGHNLLAKGRNAFQLPVSLRWVNPRLYNTDVTWQQGLRGFRIYTGQYRIDIDKYVYRNDAVYMHGVDFDDDFDGVSPAERAFLDASVEPERAQTALAIFRNLAIPAAIVQPAANETTMRPSPADAETMVARVRKALQGAINAGRTLVTHVRWDWITLQSPVENMAMPEIAEQAQLAACVAARVPLELIRPSAANYAQFQGARRFWGQTWLVPRIRWYCAQLTEQLAKEYGEYEIVPVLDDVDFLQEGADEKTAVVSAQVNSTLLTLYEAQKRVGLEPDETLRDLYMVGGVPVPRAELPNLWKAQYAQPQLTATVPAPIAPAVQAAEKSATEEPLPQGEPLWVGLYFENNPDLANIQRHVKQRFPDAVKWESPSKFHITLAYAPHATDEQRQSVVTAISAIEIPELAIRLASLRSFDSVGEHALHFRVRRNVDLMDVQEQVYDAISALDIPLSSYSVSEDWIPHITMGYTHVKPRMTPYSGGNLSLRPTCMAVCKGDDVLWRSTSNSAQNDDDAVIDEITAFGRKASNKGAVKAAGFIFHATPAHVASWLQSEVVHDAAYDALVRDAMLAVAVKAYYGAGGTREVFKSEIGALIQAARGDEMKRRSWAGAMRTLCRRYGLTAFIDGMNEGDAGVESLSPDDLEIFRAWQLESSGYITNFGDELFKEGGITDSEVSVRVDLWANKTLDDIYFAGLRIGAGNKTAQWRVDPAKEHCDSCLERDKAVKTIDEWGKIGFPRDRRLECGGWQCGCDLYTENGKRYGAR